MMELPRLAYQALKRRLSERKRSIFIGTKHLEIVAALDRKLARLIRQRDRELGVLAESFLKSDNQLSQFESFIPMAQEIRRLESERSTPIIDSSSSLTSLVIPDSDRVGDPNSTDIELIDPNERDDLYRRRLRGLYIDLGEMIYTHDERTVFAEQVSCVEQIRSEITLAKNEREALMELLPSSNRILTWIKVLAVCLVVLGSMVLFF